MVHRGEFLRPSGFGLGNQVAARVATRVSGSFAQPVKNRRGDLFGIPDDTDADRFGQADPVGVDVDLNDLGRLRPIIDAIARQGRKRIEPRAERQHHIGLGN